MRAYKTLVEELIPQANVVADRFHVIKQVNEEIDGKRRAIKNQAKELKDVQEKQRVMQGLKRSQYVLLKNEESLNEKQKEKLEQVKEVASHLGRIHQLKEEVREVFEQSNNWGEGMFKLIDWLKAAAKEFPESTKTII